MNAHQGVGQATMKFQQRIVSRTFDDTHAMRSWMEKNGEEYDKTLQKQMWDTIREVCKPRPRVRVDQASDKYRMITASADAGDFKTSTYEIARGPMMAVTEAGVKMITIAGPTQMLKTTVLESTAMYFMYIDPSPGIIVQSNDASAQDFAKNKIDPMILSTPVLRRMLKGSKNRIAGTMLHKPFPGGFLKIASAQTPIGIALNPVRWSGCDETDKYPFIKGHGHPVYMAEKRTGSYVPRHLNMRVCSPTTAEGFIWKSYLEGDRRLPFVECPHCQHDHVMRWRTRDEQGTWQYHVDYSKDGSGRPDPATAGYVCPDCGVKWTEVERVLALSQVRWRQTRPFTHCGEYQEPEKTQSWDDSQVEVDYATCKHCGERAVSNSHASFNCSRLYSPKDLSAMVTTWVGTFGNVAALMDFINNELAEPWEDLAQINATGEGLQSNQEPYDPTKMPRRALIITAGVDTQDDRLVVEIVAWGRFGESWSLHYEELDGDPKFDAVWQKLDNLLLQREWTRENAETGKTEAHRVRAVCLDTGGHRTVEVYRKCLEREKLRWFAIAGEGKMDAGLRLADPWPGQATRNNQLKVQLYRLGTRALKLQIMDHILVTEPGPGFIHSPIGRDLSWYGGLLSEKMIKKPDGSIQFKPKDGYRNEPLDCRVYALAAVEALKSADPRCFNMADFIEQGCDALGIPEEMTLEEQQWWEGRSSRRVDDLKATLAEAAEKQIRAGMAGEAPKPGRPVATAPSRQPAQVFQDQPQAVVQTDPSSVRPTIQKPFVFKKR